MANGTRPVVLVLTLVVGLAVGWLIHAPTPTPPPPPPPPPPAATPTPVPVATCPPAGHHLIEVGPASSQVSEKDAAISKIQGHKVWWIAKDASKPLTITFKPAGFPPGITVPPFEGGVDANGNQVIRCNPGGICKAGKINEQLAIPECPKVLYYKYWQKLGNDIEADAGIIIEK